MPTQNTRTISVQFHNITLHGPQWAFYGLDVLMNKAKLTCGSVEVQRDHMKSHIPSVNISRSTFGQLSVSEGCNVQISESKFFTTFCNEKPASKCFLCANNSNLNFAMSEVHMTKNYPLDFIVAQNSKVSVEQSLFSCEDCIGKFIKIINVERGTLMVKNVIFRDIFMVISINLQDNVSATMQDSTFINAYGQIYAFNQVDLLMLACRFYFTTFTQALILFTESRVTVHDSWLNEVRFSVQRSSFLVVTSSRCSLRSIIGATAFISVYDNSKVLVINTELNDGNVLYGLESFDANFTNCTFFRNRQIIETEGGLILIKDSRITGLRLFHNENSISLSMNTFLQMENTNITSNIPIGESVIFLSAEAKSHFRMTKCVYKMNDFTTHFLIKDDSTMVVVDSEISQNNCSLQILNLAERECFLEGTSLNYNTQNNLESYLSLVKLSVSKMLFSNCAITQNSFSTTVPFFLNGLASNVTIINSTIIAMNDHSGQGIIKLDDSVTSGLTYLQLLTIVYVETNLTMAIDISDSKDIRISNSQFILIKNDDFFGMNLEHPAGTSEISVLCDNIRNF